MGAKAEALRGKGRRIGICTNTRRSPKGVGRRRLSLGKGLGPRGPPRSPPARGARLAPTIDIVSPAGVPAGNRDGGEYHPPSWSVSERWSSGLVSLAVVESAPGRLLPDASWPGTSGRGLGGLRPSPGPTAWGNRSPGMRSLVVGADVRAKASARGRARTRGARAAGAMSCGAPDAFSPVLNSSTVTLPEERRRRLEATIGFRQQPARPKDPGVGYCRH